MKKLRYYLLQTGESPVELFFKNDSYASIFIKWLLLQISGLCLIYSNETYFYIAENIFHESVNKNTDKGRDFVFLWMAIFGMVIISIFSIGRALQIKRQREEERKRDWVSPSKL